MENEVLRLKDITKIYSNGFAANQDVNLCVNRHEIHALVGENGAGKTTLMKVLFGLESHQNGEIIVKGKPVKIQNPLDAIANGIGMVHQHFMQIPSVTVAENVMLGIEPVKGIQFDIKAAIAKTQAISDRYRLQVNAADVVGNLNVGLRQKVEILKALARNCEILILDEPTAVLTPQETRELFVQLKGLRDAGLAVIFISHKLEEVMEICDRVTVLRQGRTIDSKPISELDPKKISRMMVGRDVVLTINKSEPKPKDNVVEVKNLVYFDRGKHKVIDNISFSIKAGEIVGIAGVEGNGQTECSEILTGMLPPSYGTVTINNQSIQGKNIKQIRDMGVGHISEDRMRYGCAQTLAIRENIAAISMNSPEFRKGPFINVAKLNRFVDKCIEEYEVACDDRAEPIRFLSGGNIQKVIVAREFSTNANFIVANQPTRGIDVGTTEMIRNMLVKKTREDDAAILLISSDLNEVLEVSDRLLVMYKGRIVAHFTRAKDVSVDELGEYMLGLRQMSAEEVESAR